MKMYQRVAEYLRKPRLTNGFIVQYLKWRDTKTKNNKFIVFRPNGGSIIQTNLCNEYYTLIDFIGAVNDIETIDNDVSTIVDYIKNNPYTNDTGLIQIVGAIPAPVTTEEDRLVYRLLVSCKFG
ncbi:hypothetical protein B6D16_01050 [Gilliamella apicola]|uniref:phage tail termination protein n=1 Tax=Gilliamella apicola TaxID=1196095 RepID=UPI000A35694C|nr:hypothetical protein [Gilliamella apicola]QHJ81294.1 MAG: hypothetical protein [Bacteriophage sp.]OTP97222.1 hypothetical protein B6D05_01635 [Gilliamella apicola]OTQ19291.1 hypothetical protein B6D15_02510 [Gilliamella apicola]OTQ21702.1 hypothetical protein B6D16_01050 [Gilliamella apicola]OTQ23009.1 hypothetical protein B6D04_10890 [Gilliamella apicola]